MARRSRDGGIKLDKEKILTAIAPCSLCCHTCPVMKGGVIQETAIKLSHYFEGYYDFNVENLPQEHKQYAEIIKQFVDGLDKYTKTSCGGCRSNNRGKGCLPSCIIPDCIVIHNVDFCGECSEFPCDKITTDIYNETLINQWHENNQQIREKGIEEYYKESILRPHYGKYKKG